MTENIAFLMNKSPNVFIECIVESNLFQKMFVKFSSNHPWKLLATFQENKNSVGK